LPCPITEGMTADLFIIPAGVGTEGYVELGSRGATGAVFRKHVLNLGPLHYQGKTYNLDDQWYGQLERNFNNGVSMVQAPVANDSNKHSEDPLRNGGEVIGIERDGKKVYTVIDVRDPDVLKGLRNKTIMGASAMLSMNYEDSRNGQKVGPALLHHCFTNRPHVLDLDPYEEIVAATATSADMDFDSPIVLTPEEAVPEPTKEELLAQLKERFGVDVPALELAASAKSDITAITDALKNSGVLALTGGDQLSQSDVVGAIVELNAKNQQLSDDVAKLTRKDAERTVDGYIGAGRLLPKTRERAVKEILLSGPEALEDWVAPVNEPFIKMNAQEGLSGDGDGAAKHDFDIDAEVSRLGDMSNFLAGRKVNGK
jgi:hypothetical protein